MKPFLLSLCLLFLFAATNIAAAQTVIYQKKVYQQKWTQRSVLSQPKGFRPDPGIYLKHKYIKSVLKKFRSGASFIISADTYNNSTGLLGDKSDCQFVYCSKEMDKILAQSKGNVAALEKELFMRPGTLAHKKLMRIDVSKPRPYKLHIPNGNEPTATDSWTPGGHYPNGYVQGVMTRVPKDAVTATPIP